MSVSIQPGFYLLESAESFALNFSNSSTTFFVICFLVIVPLSITELIGANMR